VLVALTVGTQLWGLVGVFLGIPAAVVIKTLLEDWVVPAVDRITPPAQAPIESPAAPTGLPAVTFAPAPREAAAPIDDRPSSGPP
jgi:hypothetical protein